MQQFLFTVSSTYRSMLRMPVRESWPVDTSVGGLLMRRSVCPVSTTARPTRENLNRMLTTCVWSASLRLSLQPLLSRFVSNESCKVTYQIYFVLFQSIKNNCFILFSCIVSMFSIFTAPEIYWRKDGWVQESHLDFHFVQYARYNIKLVFFTLFLCCLILLWENGIKIKIKHFFFISEPNRPLCAEGTAETHPWPVQWRQAEGPDETRVRGTTQGGGHHHPRGSLLQGPGRVCHGQICLLCLLQMQKGISTVHVYIHTCTCRLCYACNYTCVHVNYVMLVFKAYYGGEARCDEQIGSAEDYDPRELVCGGCSDVSRAQVTLNFISLI